MQINRINYLTNFCARKNDFQNESVKIPHGVNYDEIDTIDLKRNKTISQLSETYHNGGDINQDRDKLILSRVKYILKDAKEIVKENPQYDLDDVTQDLLCLAIEQTDNDIETGKNYFGVRCPRTKENYLKQCDKFNTRENDAIQEYGEIELFNTPENRYLMGRSKIQAREKIDEMLDTLKPREKQVIIERFGLDDDKQKTLQEVGRDMYITGNRVSQIEAKALRKLRHLLEQKN